MAEAELVQVSADGQNGEEQQPINKDAQSSVRVKSKSKLKTLSPDRKAKKMEDYEWPKKSYFETRCLLDGETSGRMKNLVHRLVYIGKLRDNVGDRMDVGNHYEHLLKNLQNNFQHSEPMTGLLLVYLKHIVHVLETSSDMITEVMKDIMHEQRTEDGFLEDAKILIISHDIPSRLYQQWNFRTLDIQAARMESYESSEGADRIILDMLGQLLKLGNKLAITPKVSFKTTLDQLHEKFPDLLPQQAHLHYLMEENDQVMISPDEYMSQRSRPFDITLESEMVWPLPTKLFPYN
ncbi:testis-expressed protein 47-like isoform X2 [Mya arenaria]|uniref:testis-expressed protein 47-like isoform X2 n=1 Tax=Mya arenaria TaxID=6604 RepID=UPI0022E128A7|nr:testis-expressed protein 47-like isoform X2 [Mya arenaria]